MWAVHDSEKPVIHSDDDISCIFKIYNLYIFNLARGHYWSRLVPPPTWPESTGPGWSLLLPGLRPLLDQAGPSSSYLA